MAEPLARAFDAARGDGRAALMPYMMAGFPDLETSRAVARAYVEAGADVIELGAPFSDPLADGPVIHAAATRSLAQGTDFAAVMELCGEIAGAAPVVVMVYANVVLSLGADRLAESLGAAGAAGAIVPDLPPEEAGEVKAALAGRGIALIPLVAPTTPPDRRREICRTAEGFVYVVSDTRVTGERDDLPEHLGELVASVRAEARVPIAVGFGIGTPGQAAAVGEMADGVIVGSRLVRAVAEAGNSDDAARAVAEFLGAWRRLTT